MTQIPFHLLLPETFLALAPNARVYRTAATDPARPTSASDPSCRAPPCDSPYICNARHIFVSVKYVLVSVKLVRVYVKLLKI
jgi:hypothetical protein